jgi:hypothetical protein
VIKIEWHREIFSSVTTSVAVPVVRVLCEFTQWPPAESLTPSLQGRPHGGWAGQGAEPVPGGPPARPPAPPWGSPSTGPTSWAAGLQNQGTAAKKVVFLTNNLAICRRIFFIPVKMDKSVLGKNPSPPTQSRRHYHSHIATTTSISPLLQAYSSASITTNHIASQKPYGHNSQIDIPTAICSSQQPQRYHSSYIAPTSATWHHSHIAMAVATTLS